MFVHTYEYGQKRRSIATPKDPATVAECPRCHDSWFFFERPATIEVVTGDRTVEPAFAERLVLDNSKAATPLKRTHSISREWKKTISLESEQTRTEQVTLGLAIEGVSLGTMAEQAIRSKHSLSEEQTYTYTDSLDFEVPAGTIRRVTLSFNHTWQHGTLILTDPEEDPVRIPYKVIDSLTMDVAQEDEKVS
ncbi:MAG TPA: hypothetical protein VMS11_02830 [Solirubrobacterales bacterium]|nr:hypothetical protein [Solirubrobacterales bacterium]